MTIFKYNYNYFKVMKFLWAFFVSSLLRHVKAILNHNFYVIKNIFSVLAHDPA